MHAGRHYSLYEVALWTRRETGLFVLVAAVPTTLYAGFGLEWLSVPWLPIALIGTAVAFMTGFKNNASYGRMWEARQIWGGIVNASRVWGIMVMDFISDKRAGAPVSAPELDAYRALLIRRHVAWLTALRYQLREQRKWENMRTRYNLEYRNHYKIEEREGELGQALAPLLSADEQAHVLALKNRATHVIALQSRTLRELWERGLIDDLRHIEMKRGLADLFEYQGRAERIKNYPYPRQFATLNLLFVWLFIVLVPFGLIEEFHKLGTHFAWIAIPASVVVSWVFHTMDKIGEASENPFEGGPNDVPITALSRTIEIDLRELLGERELPPALQPTNDILS
jgi:ion channel-forming bestrophin family protein